MNTIKSKENKTEIERINIATSNFKKLHKKHINKFEKLGTWLEKESTIFISKSLNLIFMGTMVAAWFL